MCGIGAIAGLALSAGSAAANMAAQNQIDKARADAIRKENERQDRFDQRGEIINDSARGRFDDALAKAGRKQKGVDKFFRQAGKGDKRALGDILPKSSNPVLVRDAKAKAGATTKYTRQQGKALAGLRSFGDVMGDINSRFARDAMALGQIGSFQRGSQAVLPLELEAANEKGQKLQLLGDILGGVGSLAGNFSGGSSLFADAAAPALPPAAPMPPLPRPRPYGVYS